MLLMNSICTHGIYAQQHEILAKIFSNNMSENIIFRKYHPHNYRTLSICVIWFIQRYKLYYRLRSTVDSQEMSLAFVLCSLNGLMFICLPFSTSETRCVAMYTTQLGSQVVISSLGGHWGSTPPHGWLQTLFPTSLVTLASWSEEQNIWLWVETQHCDGLLRLEHSILLSTL